MYKQDPMYLFTTYSILTLILKFKKAENRRSYINSSRRFPNGKYYTCVCSLEEILRAPSTVWGGLGHFTGRAVPCREGCTGGRRDWEMVITCPALGCGRPGAFSLPGPLILLWTISLLSHWPSSLLSPLASCPSISNARFCFCSKPSTSISRSFIRFDTMKKKLFARFLVGPAKSYCYSVEESTEVKD